MSTDATHRVTFHYGTGYIEAEMSKAAADGVQRDFRVKCESLAAQRTGFIGIESPSGQVTTIAWSSVSTLTVKQFKWPT